MKELSVNYLCLYKGQSEESLADVAPYLFTWEKSSEFANWYRGNGWGRAWGLIIRSISMFDDTYKHFRKFLLVKTEDNQELYFRFYDPRVLKIFLPTCDKHQILEFFGPVEAFICEGETKDEAIVFTQKNGELITEKIPARRVFGEVAEDKIPEDKPASEEPTDGKRKPRRFIF